MQIEVELAEDHVARLAKARPSIALAELVWNSLDADAKNVEIKFRENALGLPDQVTVTDDGSGISAKDATEYFTHLGGSWKQAAVETKEEKRVIHGKKGEGRFRAFALGPDIEWYSTSVSPDGIRSKLTIRNIDGSVRRFDISTSKENPEGIRGTEVTISNLIVAPLVLDPDRLAPELTKEFALYLRKYPSISIKVGGQAIDPASIERKFSQKKFQTQGPSGEVYSHVLTVIEWHQEMPRALCLCSKNGFTFREVAPGIHAKGYNFTAYLQSEQLELMAADGTIDMEMFPPLYPLVEKAKELLREHFDARDLEEAATLVDRWKSEQVYPFSSTPSTKVENTEQEVFNVVAAAVEKHHPEFREARPQYRKLTFNLLRYAMETNPSSIRRILADVLDLPRAKQDELASLLTRTNLSAIINLSSLVADRYQFLQGLRSLLFSDEEKRHLLEREQLQPLIARNTWIFGDEFMLANDDESLLNVLKTHLGSEDSQIFIDGEVKIEGKKRGIIDLNLLERSFIGKELSESHDGLKRNLVIELKRPTQDINLEIINQVKKYAFAIAEDDRFAQIPTEWTFWALSNGLTRDAQRDSTAQDRPPGMIINHRGDAANPTVIRGYAKTWAQVIETCERRLRMFMDKLEYSPSLDNGRAFLADRFPDIVPLQDK